MKLKLMIAGAILFLLTALSGIIVYQSNKIDNLNQDVKRKDYAVSQLESDNYSIKFKNKKEFEEYIKQGNTKLKKSIDSVSKAYNIKLKDFQKVINTNTVITLRDTVFLKSDGPTIKVDSLYYSPFSFENNCLSVGLKVISTDPKPNVKLEKLSAQNEAFSVVFKEKKKWWQIFKKRKLMMKTFDNCGKSSVKELEISKN